MNIKFWARIRTLPSVLVSYSLSEFPVNFNKTVLDLSFSVHGTPEHLRGTKIIRGRSV